MRFKNYLTMLFVIVLITIPCVLFAEDVLSANDLQANPSVTAPMTVGKFKIMATSEKAVTIDVLETATKSEDGEIFNMRINLKGGGSGDYRSVRFTAKKGAEIKVYLASSSKTDARVMRLCDAKGKTVAEFSGAPYTDANASMGTVKIPANGEYYLFSVSSGMYIYMIIIK